MSCLPKPVLRGHVTRFGLKTLIGALAFATLNGCLVNYFIRLPKLRAYEEFIKTYDPKAHYEELVRYKIITRPGAEED